MPQEESLDSQNDIFSEYIQNREHYYRNMEKIKQKLLDESENYEPIVEIKEGD